MEQNLTSTDWWVQWLNIQHTEHVADTRHCGEVSPQFYWGGLFMELFNITVYHPEIAFEMAEVIVQALLAPDDKWGSGMEFLREREVISNHFEEEDYERFQRVVDFIHGNTDALEPDDLDFTDIGTMEPLPVTDVDELVAFLEAVEIIIASHS